MEYRETPAISRIDYELVGVGDINVNIGYWLGNVNDVGDEIMSAWENRE